MQLPSLPGLVSPSFLIGVLDRFFSHSLESDSKFSVYLKEWNSFKELLSQDSLNLDEIFKFVSKVQLNLSQLTQIPAKAELPQEKTPVKKSLPKLLNIATPVAQRESTPSSRFTPGPQDNNEWAQVSPSPIREITASPAFRLDTLYGSPFVQKKNLEATSQYATPVLARKITFTPINESKATAQLESGKYQLHFLETRARRLKQDFETHTDILISATRYMKPAYEVTERDDTALLKKIAVYGDNRNVDEIIKDIEAKMFYARKLGGV